MTHIRISLILAGIGLGMLSGTGGLTFWYAEGLSYFSRDPAACVNCHIMQNQYDSWQKASHHTAATCVDCHLPHDFIGKYYAKAKNGYFHSKGFTLQDFHEPIRITPDNLRILQKNCITCHEGLVSELTIAAKMETNENNCVHCHRHAGHGEMIGLGSPYRKREIERINYEP